MKRKSDLIELDREISEYDIYDIFRDKAILCLRIRQH